MVPLSDTRIIMAANRQGYFMRILRTFAAIAALAAASAQVSPASAQSPLAQQAIAAIPALEKAGKMDIVILERTGDDPGQFWYRAMQKLCQKTGENWCDQDLTQVLTDTTNSLGWTRVLTYKTAAGGQKKVCTILPPNQGISAGYVASGLAGGQVFDWRDLPTSAHAEAFLYLMHAGSCLSEGSNPAYDEKRADAFAALSMTLIEGNTAFVAAREVTPARKFSFFRNRESTRWAVSLGERVLLDLWKKEAADGLRQGASCQATVVPSTNIDTESLQRQTSLPTDSDCTNRAGAPKGSVSDENLWLWTGGAVLGASWPTVPLPPQTYTPFKSFGSFDEGVAYAWTTAGSIASQR